MCIYLPSFGFSLKKILKYCVKYYALSNLCAARMDFKAIMHHTSDAFNSKCTSMTFCTFWLSMTNKKELHRIVKWICIAHFLHVFLDVQRLWHSYHCLIICSSLGRLELSNQLGQWGTFIRSPLTAALDNRISVEININEGDFLFLFLLVIRICVFMRVWVNLQCFRAVGWFFQFIFSL